jgi:hypothetical protein
MPSTGGSVPSPRPTASTRRSAIVEADKKTDAKPAVVAQARQRERRLQAELERVLAALRAGLDPALAASEARNGRNGPGRGEGGRHVPISWTGSQANAAPARLGPHRRNGHSPM